MIHETPDALSGKREPVSSLSQILCTVGHCCLAIKDPLRCETVLAGMELVESDNSSVRRLV